MKEIYVTQEKDGICEEQAAQLILQMLDQFPDLHRVLIIPPDYTRCYSFAGILTRMIYRQLEERSGGRIHTDVMPALGMHMPMNEEELDKFFGDAVPRANILVHHWQTDTIRLGFVPGEVCAVISNGRFLETIDVEVNHLLVDGGYAVPFYQIKYPFVIAVALFTVLDFGFSAQILVQSSKDCIGTVRKPDIIYGITGKNS